MAWPGRYNSLCVTKLEFVMISSSELRDAVFLFSDIRGFSEWMLKNQHEAADLLDLYYSAAFENLGSRREQEYPRRVAKLLGDGFLVVYEYDGRKNSNLKEAIKKLIENTILFRIDFYQKLEGSTIHGKRSLKCGFGLSYGKAVRIGIPGYPLDYVSDKINFASRLVNVANKDEVVFEEDLWEYIEAEDVFSLEKDERELKKIGKRTVGVFFVDV